MNSKQIRVHLRNLRTKFKWSVYWGVEYLTVKMTMPSTQPHLQVAPNRRFLQYADGTPFFYLGDTAWELFHRLTLAEADRYLTNRAAKGFTVIQAVALAELDGLNTPNANDDRPLHDLDPTRPNEAYFRHVDAIVARANELGLVMGLLPTWARLSPPARSPSSAIRRLRMIPIQPTDYTLHWPTVARSN